MFKRTCCLLLVLWCFFHVCGQPTNYQLFEHITPGNGATVVTCFVQDRQGLIWLGTNKGLFSYDGYTTQSHFKYDEPSNIQVNCAVLVNAFSLFLGTDNGVLIYNIQTDRYEPTPVTFPTDVRTMTLQNQQLWIGTLNGLYRFDLCTRKLKHFDPHHYRALPHKTVYAIIRSQIDHIFIGTYDGLCCYVPEKNDFLPVVLPVNRRKNNQFVNSLLEDTIRQCIWIGTEGSLLKYDLSDGKTRQIEDFQDNSIKSLALDGNNRLLIGTDNGLYIYQESELPRHIIHDSRNQQSLSNNIVWTIFTDREQNSWLGTDHGISLSRCNRALQLIPISQITGSGEGNQFYSLFRDSKGCFWYGGTNGLIREQPSASVAWYKMGSRSYPLPHNRIRNIYEDRDGNIWTATDGSVNRFDDHTSQFVQYTIVDSTGTCNSNWAYYLFEDNQGQLWIATCLGGVFVVNKQKLMQSRAHSYVADYTYTSSNGLSGMFINQIVPDRLGHVWVLLYNNGIDRIDTRTRKVTPVSIPEYTGGRKPNYLLCDRSGMIWVGFRGGILGINPGNQHVRTVRFDAYSNTEVLSMVEVEGTIWVSTTDGFWVVDKHSFNASRLNLSEKRFTSLFYDETSRSVYLGGVDGVGLTSPDVQSVNTLDRPIIATAVFVNNTALDSLELSIRYIRQIKLKYKQNNFSVDFSDLPYSMEEKNQFVYQLEGLDNGWNQLSPNTNRISYSNLDYGFYRLIVSKLDANGKPSGNRYSLNIRILPPWYYTNLAKGFYLLLLISLVVWTVNFFRIKNRLKIEHIEKEKILEQSRMKIDFFTNLSHEMKTPLSMIIAPVSKIISDNRNQRDAQQLSLVLRNAMKLNSQIHELLDFNRMDNDANTLLILSETDMVALARRVFAVFEEAGKQRNLLFHFQTNRETVYLEIDVIKWESILNNLLSNAVKYTPDGGIITLSLEYREEEQQMDISVSDTGIGIPEKDTPYIFQRFFQSSKTAGKKEGTGVGLYLVKTYTELHGGKVSLSSEENKGTTIRLRIPVRKEATIAEIGIFEQHAAFDHQSEQRVVSATPDCPLILVVDDNSEITNFIADSLNPYYRCLLAADGKTGLELCLEHKPDLIISDIMMPVMDGLEMCQSIRKNVPTSTVPIILLTAVNDKETELESIHLNIDAYITKPFQPDILLSRVNQLIQKNQTLEARLRMEAITAPREIEAVSYDEKFLSSITKIIEDHLDDADLNVTALCTISGINNKQIYRKLKQLTAMVPVDYIKSIRMKKAAMLLAQKKFTVAEVMYMVGFSNHSYFSKCFQSAFHKTPVQFREDGEQHHLQ